MRVIPLRPPGAGKGTKLLCERFGFPHLSTGNISRAAIYQDTDLEMKAKATVEAGGFVGDDIVNGCVLERTARRDSQKAVILDGYPRTREQASYFDEQLSAAGLSIDVALEVQVDAEHVTKHIRRRVSDAASAGQEQRSDDAEETLRARIANSRKKTAPLSDCYRVKGKLRQVDGLADVATVKSHLVMAIKAATSPNFPSA